MSGSSGRQFFGLDLIRFSAAAQVAVFHLCYLAWVTPDSTPGEVLGGAAAYPELARLGFGWVGINVFFVLSGFVIAYTAEKATPGRFLHSRALRLFPAVWICAPLSALAWLSVGQTDLFEPFVRSLTLWPFGLWIDGVYWTLGIELAFYALVLGLLLTGAFHRIGWLAWALCAATIVNLVFQPMPPGRWRQLLLLDHGAFFALGIFFWLALVKGPTVMRIVGVLASLPVCLIAIQVTNDRKLGSPGWMAWAPGAVWLLSVLAIPIAVRFLGARDIPLTRRIGLMTYPLYLVHDVCGAAIIRWLVSHGVDRWVALATALTAALLASWLIVDLERPLRRFLGLALDATSTLLRRLAFGSRP